ncbi:hypothetical protein JXA88_07275 [Candidatus Fermentibacteria bacterium]|nr:hypothetical protein [Candidatus Fermentibacteria bacterium]
MIRTQRISRRRLADILHLVVALREDFGRTVDPRRMAEALHELMGKREGGLHVLVAWEGRFPVGYLMGGFTASTVHMGLVFCIHELYVSKPYRGGATLKALEAEALRFAASKGARSMEVRLRRTQRELILLAEAMSFEPTGREVFERIIESE